MSSNRKKAEGTSLERCVRFVLMLLDGARPVPYDSFRASEWGSDATLRKFLSAVNSTWELHKAEPLFDYVDENGSTWRKGQPRFIRLRDQSIKAANAMNLAVMPVYLQLLSSLRGTAIEADFKQLYAEGQGKLSQRERQLLAFASKRFIYRSRGFKDYSAKASIVGDLYRAVLETRLVDIERESSKTVEAVRERLAPLAVVLFNNALYAVFRKEDGKKPGYMTLGVDKILRLKKTTKHFVYPAEFDAERHFEDAFGMFHEQGERYQVELAVLDKKIVQYLKSRRWTRTDRYFEKDGRTHLAFTTSSLVEVRSWVLGFGGAIEVMMPKSLRRQVGDDVARMAALYR